MNHLFINRDYPPASCHAGGIGTYVDHMSRLLAAAGETVHVIGQRWPGAPRARQVAMDGRLIVHRVALDEPLPHAGADDAATLRAFRDSLVPVQAFAWQAARLAETLIEREGIDVIEAQEYEAPLYYLLRRRALGIASVPLVPIIVQIHTGTEFVYTHNNWPQDAPNYLATKALEDYTIRGADAVLCPSRFLGRIAEEHYGLRRGSIEVLPYPVGDNPVLERSPETWVAGTISYVGRLEPRKGVKEWVEAAVAVAGDVPEARFTLVGADTPYSGAGGASTGEVARSRIPAPLRSRFQFFDFAPRHRLAAHLQRARIAVVPSRWENFPNTCIEAMSSGLPVLVSPTGGMAEMIEDGRTGWIADGPDAGSLEAGLRRALATPPRELAEMGHAAAASIRRLCDSERIVRRQLDFRHRVVTRGCVRSTEIAPALTTSTAVRTDKPGIAHAHHDRSGVAIVVTSRGEAVARGCLNSLDAQTVPPAHVVLLVAPNATVPDPFPSSEASWRAEVLRDDRPESPEALRAAIRAVQAVAKPTAIAFLDDSSAMLPEYVQSIGDLFIRCDEVDVVATWSQHNGKVRVGLGTSDLSAWLGTCGCVAVRTTAVPDSCESPSKTADDAIRGLCNGILENGGYAALFPRVLVSAPDVGPDSDAAVSTPAASGRTITPLELFRAGPQLRRDLFRRALAEPAYVVQWLIWHARKVVSYR